MANNLKTKIFLTMNLAALILIAILLTKLGFIYSLEKVGFNQIGLAGDGLLLVNWGGNTKDAQMSSFRFSDGKEMIFKGLWSHRFTALDEAVIYGFKANEPKKQDLYLLNTKKLITKDNSSLAGPIMSIEPNPAGDYWLISGLNKTTSTAKNQFYTCLLAKDAKNTQTCLPVLGGILAKKQFDAKLLYASSWNTQKSHELIIKETGGKNQLFAYDAKTKKLATTTKDQTDNGLGSSLSASSTIDFSLKRFSKLVIYKDNKTKKRYIFLAPKKYIFAPISANHLLAIDKRDNHVYFINMATKQISDFITLPTNKATLSIFGFELNYASDNI